MFDKEIILFLIYFKLVQNHTEHFYISTISKNSSPIDEISAVIERKVKDTVCIKYMCLIDMFCNLGDSQREKHK